ncbi:glucose-1-phosphate thymidylyltransferase [Halosimplex rubrum]|uniref:Bifunctional protein GlmU n=1 Tax=Halosimplex rubrum TaxID=869889 RepID=A0A7D5NZG7_9EURY|nr:glucose-1-phosphate thymidylyltransferase [Halosimplex rubrum]QLH77283.1 glucose-1-phosphate thymidylyltransferase [Halosimplex rubrum]
MKGLVLAGGTGSRLRPITHTGPKQLIPVANKPVVEYAIEDLRAAGIDEIGVVLGHKGREAIQSLLGDGSDYGVEITYVVQGAPLGLAHAAGCARAFVGDDDFVMYLGDNLLNRDIGRLVERFEAGDGDAAIALQHVDRPRQFGIAAVDDDGTVRRLVEKPDDPPSDLALVGIYVFSPAVFDAIADLEPSWRGELEITDALQWLLDEGRAVDAHVVEGWWKDTGKPGDVLDANRLVLEDIDPADAGRIADGARTRGRVDLRDGAEIEASAVVRGPVSIGEGATVRDGAYVGPYTSIGPGSTVAEAHVENSVLIGAVDVDAEVRIVDSLVGRNASIESADGHRPDGHRLVVGENSELKF